MTKYSSSHIRAFYDEYARTEWDRFESSPANRVNFHVHKHYLKKFVKEGDYVLEAGSGPGRFTIEMAKLGAQIVVGDISPVQLELNREKVEEAGVSEFVINRVELDILDLSGFKANQFDLVVCFGGPLSYVFEGAGTAVSEMLRVTKPGGHVLISVMSNVGAFHIFLPGVLEIAQEHGIDVVRSVWETGDLLDDRVAYNKHYMHMFKWTELKDLLEMNPCKIVAASAANYLVNRNEEAAEKAMEDPDLWARFLAWEVEVCRELGAIDGGTHIIAVVKKNE